MESKTILKYTSESHFPPKVLRNSREDKVGGGVTHICKEDHRIELNSDPQLLIPRFTRGEHKWRTRFKDKVQEEGLCWL